MTPVEQIKERLSIHDIVGAYVELEKAGRHYKGKSPFTNEKTPSFFVSPDRGMYYCFSSQKGGDMFTFIEEMEGVDFKGALKILAEKANVELVPEDPKKRDARETQYALLEAATQFFFKEREKHPEITTYVETRGVTGATMHAWRIGYAPDEWRALRSHLTEKKFTDEQMLAAGLIKKADGGKEPYDVFRDRVMFPIADSSGRVVAFSGRTMKKEDNVPKYVNSPETEFYQKSEILYGYDKAKQGIRSYDFSLVVEGQFDVVLGHQAGYTNTVAVSGTALTAHHVTLLERLSGRAVLALDSDRAGISAVQRSSEIMLPWGMDVKVARMNDGEDPADVIRDDPAKFKKVIGDSKHVVEFLLGIFKERAKDERTHKLMAREEILPLLLRIPNRIDREHFEGVVADAIGTTKDAIHFEVERLAVDEVPTEDAREVAANTKEEKTDRIDDLSMHLYVLSLVTKEEYPALGKQITEYMKEILGADVVKEYEQTPESILSKHIFTLEAYISSLPPKQLYEEVGDSITQLRDRITRKEIGLLRDKIRAAEQSADEELSLRYVAETKELQEGLLRPVVLTGLS